MKILLYKSHKGDPLCFAIDALTRGEYCHAAILVESSIVQAAIRQQWGAKYDLSTLGHMLVESYFPHVRPRVLTSGELPGIDVFSVPCLGPDKEIAVEHYCASNIQEINYSVRDLFLFSRPGEGSPWRTFA
jgi:hypothetical protein